MGTTETASTLGGTEDPMTAKLQGKGRVLKEHETVFLPPVIPEPKHEEPKPPGEPPKIWGGVSKPQ
jgi:hypothetical protein